MYRDRGSGNASAAHFKRHRENGRSLRVQTDNNLKDTRGRFILSIGGCAHGRRTVTRLHR
jgi:hypothetical protein